VGGAELAEEERGLGFGVRQATRRRKPARRREGPAAAAAIAQAHGPWAGKEYLGSATADSCLCLFIKSLVCFLVFLKVSQFFPFCKLGITEAHVVIVIIRLLGIIRTGPGAMDVDQARNFKKNFKSKLRSYYSATHPLVRTKRSRLQLTKPRVSLARFSNDTIFQTSDC